jgi:hypothetical protein
MKVASVQLNLKHCFSQKSFQSYIEKQVFENLLIKPDVICFPENINYCLLFAKQEKISSLNIKNNFESLFDKVISKLISKIKKKLFCKQCQILQKNIMFI